MLTWNFNVFGNGSNPRGRLGPMPSPPSAPAWSVAGAKAHLQASIRSQIQIWCYAKQNLETGSPSKVFLKKFSTVIL